MSSVRTRFAPSPTGYMHIGGMRTALFNWLWARHHNGQFILRIDDTDQQRNVEAALAPILEAFRWLGLDWDEGPEKGGPHGPYFQSQRTPLYQKACDQLLATGKAYKDFDPPELSQADREAAEKEKRPYLNIRRSLDLTPAQIEEFEQVGRPYVVRFFVDRNRKIAIDDHVRDHVEWDAGLIPDPVIMRSNGIPLYNFASVVDDIDLKISHIIRAEEHLPNTPIQAMLFEALGATAPEFAHIPFVAAPGTKEKLSKREKKIEKYRKSPQFKRLFDIADDVLPKLGLGNSETLNPVMVAYYEATGFLPEAVLNALSRLGWSLDDKTEHMSLPFVVEHFTLDRVVKAPAGLDPDKLLSFQEYWMSQRPLEDKVDGCLSFLVQAGVVTQENVDRDYLRRVVVTLGDRIKLMSDILNYDEYFVSDENLIYDEKNFDKRIRRVPEARDRLGQLHELLAGISPFQSPEIEAAFQNWLTQQGLSHGDAVHALRIAVSGKAAGPGLFDCLETLGKDRCLRRIDLAIERAANSC